MKLRFTTKVGKTLQVETMKAPTLELKKKKKSSDSLGRVLGKRGPKPVLKESQRFSFFITRDVREQYDELLEEYKDNGITAKISLAEALREGAKLYLAQRKHDLQKALKGKYHAKHRTERD